MKETSNKQEKNPLLDEANNLAEHLYGTLQDFPKEEKWYTATKLRSAIIDTLFFLSIASSNKNPVGGEFEWMNVSKPLGALITMYRFAGRQKFIELEPEIMMRLNKLASQIDTKTDEASKASEAFRIEQSEKELQPWVEKYNIFKKISKGQQ